MRADCPRLPVDHHTLSDQIPLGLFPSKPDLQSQILNFQKCFSISLGIVNRIMIVSSLPVKFLPFIIQPCVHLHAAVKISDAATGMAKGIFANKVMEIIVDPLPVKGRVITDENRPAF